MLRLTACVATLLICGSVQGQTSAQDAMRRFQEAPRLRMSNQERAEMESDMAAEDAQAQLLRENMQLRGRSRLTMRARIAAHRANRVSQKFIKRAVVSFETKAGAAIGIAAVDFR